MNFGLHYDHELVFKRDLNVLVKDLEDVKQQCGEIPHIFYLESSPQHFDTSPGEYYKGFNRLQDSIDEC